MILLASALAVLPNMTGVAVGTFHQSLPLFLPLLCNAAKGKDLTPEMTEFFGSQCFGFEPTTLEKLNPATLPDLGSKGSKGGYGGGYSKGQTELERLNDRWEFAKKVTGCDVKDIHELTEACKGMYGQSYPDVLEMLKALTA